MQDELEAEVCDELGDLVEMLRQPVPGGVVERLGSRPAGAHHHRCHEDIGTGIREHPRDPLRLGAGGRRVRLVQHQRHEAADEPQAVALELCSQGGRVEGKPVDGAELGRAEAERLHLGEHTLGRQHQAPAGHLADAPGDGGGGDPSSA